MLYVVLYQHQGTLEDTWSRTAVISVPWSKYDVGSRGALTSHSQPLNTGKVQGAGRACTSAWCLLFWGWCLGFSGSDLNFIPSVFGSPSYGLGVDPSSGIVENVKCVMKIEKIVWNRSLTKAPVCSVGMLCILPPMIYLTFSREELIIMLFIIIIINLEEEMSPVT